jgi:glutamate-1-semialdehyde aminotransferase
MAAGIRTLELFDRKAIGELNRLGEALRSRLNGMGDRAGLDLVVTGAGSFMQAHFLAAPPKNPREASLGDKRLLRLLHLGLLTSGVFVSSRQMYVLSTAMSENVVQEFDRRFEAVLERIGAAVRQAQPASAGA